MAETGVEAGSEHQALETEQLAKLLLEMFTPEQIAAKYAQYLIWLKELSDRRPTRKPLEQPRLGFNRVASRTYQFTEAELQRIIGSELEDFGLKVVKAALREKGKFLSKKANNSRHETNRDISARAMLDWDAWQGAKNGKKVASRFAAERCDVYGIDEATIRKWIRKHEAKKKAQQLDAPKQ